MSGKAICTSLAALAAALLLIAAAPAEQARIACVIDGDTVRLASGERVRIAGIDSPELHRRQARCAKEVEQGRSATARARALLEGRVVTIVRLGRSYNRTVAELRLDGRDVATQLVQSGIAKYWPRGRAKPDWCSVRP